MDVSLFLLTFFSATKGGFDCSGLALYAIYQGTGKKLPHKASSQYSGCTNYQSYSNAKPGDLVFVSIVFLIFSMEILSTTLQSIQEAERW